MAGGDGRWPAGNYSRVGSIAENTFASENTRVISSVAVSVNTGATNRPDSPELLITVVRNSHLRE